MTQSDFYEAEKAMSKDHVATPGWVVEQMYDLIGIRQFSSVWFPFNNYDSEFKLRADELRIRYKATHIFDDRRQDFFTTDPPDGCDLLISNPPFSIQNEIIERTFALADAGKVKAFALLLPLSTLETPARSRMWESHLEGLSVLIFRKRIAFKNKAKTFNAPICWVCWNVPTIHQKLAWLDSPTAKRPTREPRDPIRS